MLTCASPKKAMLAKLNLGSFSGVPQPSEPQSKGSPGPSNHEKALIRKLEEQNFHNATTSSSIEQQRLVNQKKEEIERNKVNKQRVGRLSLHCSKQKIAVIISEQKI